MLPDLDSYQNLFGDFFYISTFTSPQSDYFLRNKKLYKLRSNKYIRLPNIRMFFNDIVYPYNQGQKVVPWFYDNVTNRHDSYYVIFAFANDEAKCKPAKSYNSQADGSERTN